MADPISDPNGWITDAINGANVGPPVAFQPKADPRTPPVINPRYESERAAGENAARQKATAAKFQFDLAKKALYDSDPTIEFRNGRWGRVVKGTGGGGGGGGPIDLGQDPSTSASETKDTFVPLPPTHPLVVQYKKAEEDFLYYASEVELWNTYNAADDPKEDEAKGGYVPTWANATVTQGFGPTDEPLDGPYGGYENFNKGWDFGLKEGTPIDAAVGGTVVSVGDSDDGWGISVKVRDANGYTHNYGHLSGTNVKKGDVIPAGAIVGLSGNTGNSTGPHLSYDVWDSEGTFIDPRPWVEGKLGGMYTDGESKVTRAVTLDDFMAAIMQQESGGRYDITNDDSGAAGAFQIMPENWPVWSREAGLPEGAEMTPENQRAVARFKMQQYFNQTGDWADVASMWYSGQPRGAYTEEELNRPQGGGKYPSINEYIGSVTAKLGAIVTSSPSGATIGPDGRVILNTGAKVQDPTLDQILFGWDYPKKVGAQDEISRQYDDAIKRAKDYLALLNTENGIGADAADMIKLNADIQDKSQQTAAEINAAVRAGKLPWTHERAGPIWSNILTEFMPRQPERSMADMFYAGVPEYVMPDLRLNQTYGLPGVDGWDDQDFANQPWVPKSYGLGTIHRYAEGTVTSPQDQVLIDQFNAGLRIPYSDRVRLGLIGQEPGSVPGGTKPVSGSPTPTGQQGTTPAGGGAGPRVNGVATYTSWAPGRVPANQYFPPGARVPDINDHINTIVESAIINILATGQYPPGYNGPNLDSWVNSNAPASQIPQSAINGIWQWAASAVNNPEIVAIYGAPPQEGQQLWVDPENPYGETETPSSQPSLSGDGSGIIYAGGYNSGAGASNTPQSPVDPNVSAQLAARKEEFMLQMEWEKEKFGYQKEIDFWEQQFREKQWSTDADFRERQFNSDAEYRSAQIALDKAKFEYQKMIDAEQSGRWREEFDRRAMESDRLYDQQVKQFIEQQAQNAWQRGMTEQQFQHQLFMDGERLGIDRETLAEQLRRNKADEEFRTQQAAWEQAFAREQQDFAREQWEYQKGQDAKKQNLEWAKVIANVQADPNDMVEAEYFKNLRVGETGPVGEGIDLFTGKKTGQKTFRQAQEEDAAWFKQFRDNPLGLDGTPNPLNPLTPGQDPKKKPTGPQVISYGSGGPIRAKYSIVGDDPHSDKATGFEEMIINHGDGSYDVASNKDLREMKLVPGKGKKLPPNIKKGS